jgi:hypothetical protein
LHTIIKNNLKWFWRENSDDGLNMSARVAWVLSRPAHRNATIGSGLLGQSPDRFLVRQNIPAVQRQRIQPP